MQTPQSNGLLLYLHALDARKNRPAAARRFIVDAHNGWNIQSYYIENEFGPRRALESGKGTIISPLTFYGYYTTKLSLCRA